MPNLVNLDVIVRSERRFLSHDLPADRAEHGVDGDSVATEYFLDRHADRGGERVRLAILAVEDCGGHTASW
jgi:hypothetical protein